MIKQIWVQNFKSLSGEAEDGFELNLSKVTFLLGLNGAGKTTILQFFDFLSYIMRGKVTSWLSERNWKAIELNYVSWSDGKVQRKKNIHYRVVVDFDGHDIVWEAEFNRDKLYLVSEKVIYDKQTVLRVEKGEYIIGDRKVGIDFSYEGSILGSLKPKVLPPSALALKETILGITSRELLSPVMLRKSSRGVPIDIGRYGETLSAYAGCLSYEEEEELTKTLRPLFPSFKTFVTLPKKAGWKDLYLFENQTDKDIIYKAKHASDGLLRMFAMHFDMSSHNPFVMFEEIENGISPEVLQNVVSLILNASTQIVVTTHSPLVLNYLTDEQAMSTVVFLFKTGEGYTRAVPLFEIEEMKRRLDVMGPGEAFIDVSLQKLSDRLASSGVGSVGSGL